MAATPGVPVAARPPEGFEKWFVIYPCYIDPTKKCSEGRRISKEKCKDCEAGAGGPVAP